MLSWVSWMIWRWRQSELSTYFLSQKYKELFHSSHSARGIWLWCRTSLRSASRTWGANWSWVSACSHNVCVGTSAGSSSGSGSPWSSWGSTSLTSGSSVSIFMGARMMGNEGEAEQRCSWMRSRTMIWHCKSMVLGSRHRFFLILSSRTCDFCTVWCWYWWHESRVSLSLGRSSERWVKALGLPPAFPGQYVIW